ncbi:hypothetical protein HFO56_23035 [Rhizobium laguerreae]|uniref:hypothetical protein n=1 Tax=Rhizobium laguerreae TaxID=1076926 RepID=UPI001C90BADB|nr:hypothetical protein [Rhizobium laguerreae]MBY3155200.1 hypothetical protein [Rhizobium laguerreae]
MRNMFRLPEGQLDRQYLRVCATFKLLKLCKIDETRAVELLEERRIRGADGLVSKWVETLRRNEWSDGGFWSTDRAWRSLYRSSSVIGRTC